MEGSKFYGIDVNALARPNRTGVERYVLELVTEMKKQPLMEGERVFLYSSEIVDDLGELPAGWEWKILSLPILKKGWTHLRLSWELLVSPPDVFFSPAHEIPLFYRRTKIVNTIHDIAFVHVPEVYTFFNRMRQRWAIWRSARRSSRILTVSETTKDDLIEFYDISPEVMTVSRLGVRPEQFKVSDHELNRVLDEHDLKEHEYLFTIGRVEKKKGIGFLIEVFEKFLKENPSSKLQLVLGGKMGNGQDEIQGQIDRSPVSDRIHVLGFVPQKDLAPLMRGSFAYVFPSRYEGFGIPSLEAMASGTPVIASNIPALREICGDAAYIASIESVSEWIASIQDLGSQENRMAMIEKGVERIKEFNWEDTAKTTWVVLRSL